MQSYWDRVLTKRVTRRRAIASTGALTASAAFLAACGGDDDDDDDDGGGGAAQPTQAGGGAAQPTPGGGGASAGGAQYGGTFGQTYGSSDSLNILTNPSEYAGMGGQFVYDHLISTRTNDKAPYILEAAEGLEQPDEITLTFKLRQGMKYHNYPPVNGREVVAEDVKLMQEYAGSLEGIENNFQVNFLDHVEAPDNYTVIYVLKAPRAYLFDSRILGHPGPQAIIPHETFDGLNSERQIGSGPFIPDEWTINNRYDYVRNPEYHSWGMGEGVLPYRDKTTVLILQDQSAFEAAFRSEQVSYWTLIPAGNFDSLASSLSSLAQVVQFNGLNPFTWVLNVRTLFQDERVREACYRGTNRDQFIDLIYSGNAAAPTGFLSAAMTGYQLDASETEEYFLFDPAEGKKLIEASGFDQDREVRIMFSGTGVNQQGAEVLKQQWAEIGIKLVADQTQGISEMSPRTLQGDYDTFIGGHPGYDTPSVVMRHNSSDPKHQFAVSGLVDPHMDELVVKAEATTDLEANIEIVKEAQLYAISHYTGYYNIVSPINRNLLNLKVQDFEVEASNVAMHRSDLWIKA